MISFVMRRPRAITASASRAPAMNSASVVAVKLHILRANRFQRLHLEVIAPGLHRRRNGWFLGHNLERRHGQPPYLGLESA